MTDEQKKEVNVDAKGMMTMVMPLVQKYTALLEKIEKEQQWQHDALVRIYEQIKSTTKP